MLPTRFDIDVPDEDPDGICLAQTTAGAANLLLNGALISGGVFTFSSVYGFNGGAILNLTSAGNLSGVTFTFTGTDENGTAVTVTRAGPNSNTVELTTYLSSVSNIAVDGAVGTNVTIGTADGLATKIVFPNWRSDYPFTFAVYGLTGTIQYDIEESFSDPTGSAFLWIDNQSNKTTDLAGSFTRYACGARLVVDSYSSGAELQFAILGN